MSQLYHRVRAFWLSTEDVAVLFIDRYRSFERLWFKGIPRDASVLGVEFSLSRRGWMILLEHASFDPVSVGCDAPVEVGTVEMVPVSERIEELESRVYELQQELLAEVAKRG